MLTNRSMPGAAVIPVLAYPNVEEAVRWLCDTFRFKPRIQIATHCAQLKAGDGAVVVTEQRGTGDQCSCSVMVRVEDVNQHHQNAKQRGAKILSPPADFPYGERQYSVEDLAGHQWMFSQSIADIDPADWGGTMFSD
jgi:uncharacterized glyoxalase superfamily protein PhnB